MVSPALCSCGLVKHWFFAWYLDLLSTCTPVLPPKGFQVIVSLLLTNVLGVKTRKCEDLRHIDCLIVVGGLLSDFLCELLAPLDPCKVNVTRCFSNSCSISLVLIFAVLWTMLLCCPPLSVS